MTKLEDVALAIRAGRRCESGEVPCPFCRWGPDDLTAGQDETGCIWLARAAIEALREPSEGMKAIGNEALGEAKPADYIYRAMLTAALEEE